MLTMDQKQCGDYVAKWGVDETTDVESPRSWGNMGTFFGFHRRYVSPDTAPDSDPIEARRIAESRDNICLPVWLYDHSSTYYRAAESNPFHCPWDSGLFGFIYVSRADARKAFNVKRLTKETEAKVIEALKAEVESYSAWANGEIYAWYVENSDGDVMEFCTGYIGEMEVAKADAITFAKQKTATDQQFLRDVT